MTDKNCKVDYFEAGEAHDDPGINCGKVPREMQGPKPLFRASFLLATFFRCTQSTQEILFNSYSFFTSFLHAPLPPVSPGMSSRPNRTLPFFLSSRPVTSRPRKHHELFIREVHWEEYLRIPVNVLDFPRSLASLHPFTLSCARCKDEELEFHGC